MASAITVSGLAKSYGAVQAVREVSFTVGRGEIFALLGPNGAGKTTTLEILEGFRGRDAGQADVLGLDPGDRATGRALRERIGLVLQDIAVEPYLTVRETLARNAGYYRAPRDVGEVIALAGLAGQERKKVRNLSGGLKRRLDLGLGLIGDPELLFLDEPTTGFDPAARQDAWQLVRGLRGRGTTILLTTHYMDEAQALADRVAVMSAGRIVAEGTPSDLGGRDTARARIRFALPRGHSAADLPPGAVPDGAVPDGAVPDGAAPDGPVPDGAVPDGPVPDGPVPDGPVPDGPVPDGPVPDGAVPDGAVLADVGAVPGDGLITVQTSAPTETLHQLTGWALSRGITLDRLTVDRPSLEDVYLGLTDGTAAESQLERSIP